MPCDLCTTKGSLRFIYVVAKQSFSPGMEKGKGKVAKGMPLVEDDMSTNDFDSGSEPSLDIVCNVVYVLPVEYNCKTEVEEPLTSEEVEMAKHKPICYYFMNNSCVEEHNVFFERPACGMKSDLKPLFIRVKIENTSINKVLVDGGAVVYLMPHLILNKIDKFDTYLRPHNMVLSNYEGKIDTTMGVIQVDITVGTITRPTIFMVISLGENYNLVLGREWIHGIRVVPSTLHQRISIR